MQKITLTRRNIIISATYLFLIVAVFTIAFLLGYNSGENSILLESSSHMSVPKASSSPTLTPHTASYRVILEDREIRLYIDENGISRLISREEITEDAYPVSDIASLKNGFTFDNMNSAITLIENFIS